MLADIGLSEDDLRCDRDLKARHNCSGNHTGMLAACVRHGWDVATYQRADHPAQVAGVESVAEAAGIAASDDALRRGRLRHPCVLHADHRHGARLCAAAASGAAHRGRDAGASAPHRGRGRRRHGDHAGLSRRRLEGRRRRPVLRRPPGRRGYRRQSSGRRQPRPRTRPHRVARPAPRPPGRAGPRPAPEPPASSRLPPATSWASSSCPCLAADPPTVTPACVARPGCGQPSRATTSPVLTISANPAPSAVTVFASTTSCVTARPSASSRSGPSTASAAKRTS